MRNSAPLFYMMGILRAVYKNSVSSIMHFTYCGKRNFGISLCSNEGIRGSIKCERGNISLLVFGRVPFHIVKGAIYITACFPGMSPFQPREGQTGGLYERYGNYRRI